MASKLYHILLAVLICCLIYLGFIQKSYKIGSYIPTTPERRAEIIKEWKLKLNEKPNDPIVLKTLSLYLFKETIEVRNKNHTENTLNILEQALKQSPQDYEIMAALGNVLAFSTLFIKNDVNKINVRNKRGVHLLDTAVQKAPTHIGVRLQRAYSSYHSPMTLNRTQVAIDDFLTAIELVGNDFGPYFEVEVKYHLGKAYEILGDKENSLKYLKEVTQLKLPNNKWINRAKEALSDLDNIKP